MTESTGKWFVEVYDKLVKWKDRTDDCYCPLHIISIRTHIRRGPARDNTKVAGNRCYDEYCLFAVLENSVQEIKSELSRRGHMHPLDEAFWDEALDWMAIGSVFGNDDEDRNWVLYQTFCLPSSNDKELCREIDQLEQYFRAQRPNSNLEFERPYSSGSGCYVATAVYGSYDCPEVWTLRRFRDQRLAETAFGRAFIRLYYAISPTVVRWFGKTAAFNKFFRKRLDRLVARLQREGMENTLYRDK